MKRVAVATNQGALFADAPAAPVRKMKRLVENPRYDITANRHGGNRQSAAAAVKISMLKAESRRRVLEYAISRGAQGITTDEVSEHFDLPPNAVSGRLSELKATGDLVPTERRRVTRSKCSAAVLVAKQFRSDL